MWIVFYFCEVSLFFHIFTWISAIVGNSLDWSWPAVVWWLQSIAAAGGLRARRLREGRHQRRGRARHGVVGRPARTHPAPALLRPGPGHRHPAPARQAARQTGPVLQLVVVQVELFRYFPPAVDVKEVVGSPLVGGGLLAGHHARGPGYPHPLLFVIPAARDAWHLRDAIVTLHTHLQSLL